MTTLTHRNIIRDNASQLAYAGATDFDGVPHQEYALAYNESGSLVGDEGRNIANIEYDNLNNPVRIQFTNGNVTKYVYSAAGEKLRVIYQTAVPNITVATGSTRELTPSETLYTDSIDYLLGGALTLRNGRIDKFQFDEGYCQAEAYTSTKDDFTFCYYDKDHLGNVRQVTELDGTSKGDVIQKNNYYPFGAEFCDNWAKSYIQRHKYNGKEFDNMHGLNTYDYGARQYNPVTARWDRVDPLAHEYYDISPYGYCKGDPINQFDPDGRVVIKGVVSAIKYARRLHNVYKKTGKLSFANLKKAGLSEIVDTGGDIQTIFDKDASTADKLSAVSDLLIGTNFNSKGQKEIGSLLRNEASKESRKVTISGIKNALQNVKNKLGLSPNESLPKQKGKFGSPSRGNQTKGYRLDPPHPKAKEGSGEDKPHINYWDYTQGKRKSGGISGVEPIKQ